MSAMKIRCKTCGKRAKFRCASSGMPYCSRACQTTDVIMHRSVAVGMEEPGGPDMPIYVPPGDSDDEDWVVPETPPPLMPIYVPSESEGEDWVVPETPLSLSYGYSHSHPSTPPRRWTGGATPTLVPIQTPPRPIPRSSALPPSPELSPSPVYSYAPPPSVHPLNPPIVPRVGYGFVWDWASGAYYEYTVKRVVTSRALDGREYVTAMEATEDSRRSAPTELFTYDHHSDEWLNVKAGNSMEAHGMTWVDERGNRL